MLRSLVLMGLLTLSWGFNWSVIKIGVSHLPPLWFRSIGLVLGTAVLGAALMMRGTSLRLPPRSLGRIVALSLPNIMIWYSAVTVALTMLQAGRAAILGFTMPVWAALIGALVHRESIDARNAVGVACSVAAIALLVAGDWTAIAGHPLGIGLMLFAAASWAWGTHALRRANLPIDTAVLTFWMMAVACPVIVGASAVFEGSQWRMPDAFEWLPILYNAILVLAIGNLIWFLVARSLPPTAAGLSSMLVPVVGVFSGMALLGEVPTWRDFAALFLICAAVAVGLFRARVEVEAVA